MVTVPLYQQNVSTRPIFQQDLAAQATPEAFGADIGRGLKSVAGGLDQAATAVAQVQELEDITRAKEADNNYSNWLREAMYGDQGFMTLEGKNAVDGRKAFEQAADQKRSEFAKGLNPQASQAYNRASQARLQSTYQQSIVHTANERKSWFKSASVARIDTFANDALANFKNPALADKNIAAGLLELRSQGSLEGWDGDVLKNKEIEYTSGVRKNIALMIAQSDPVAADAYAKKYEKQLTGAHRYDLTSALETGLIEAQAVRETEAILSEGRKVSDLPGDMVAEVAGVTEGGGGPRRSKAFLSSISAHKNRPGDTLNLDDAFADNLAAMIQDAPPGVREKLGLMSAYRSNERQKRLFADSDRTGHSVAFPAGYTKPDGSIAKGSNHLHGRAVDLSYNGRSLRFAPQEVIDWVHGNASKYGMFFPMKHEPWHIEPARDGRSDTVAARNNTLAPRTSMPSYDEIESRLDKITDPKVRDLVRRRLNAQIEATNKAVEMREKSAKAELWKFIDQGGTPDQLPSDVKQDAGLSAVNSAWEYIDKMAKRQEVESDETLIYDMRKYAAMKPEEFAELDLNDYRDRLSKADIKELTGLQTGALTDSRKAREDGLNLTTAFSQASTQLEAVGITTAGKEGKEREEAARRIAQFNNSLAKQMDEFKREKGTAPTQLDIQSMVNRMLLPVVIKTEKSVWNPTKTPWSAFNESGGFSFELGGIGPLADGTNVEVNIQYADIPPRERIEIEVVLESQLGRKPSEEEVTAAYERFLVEAK